MGTKTAAPPRPEIPLQNDGRAELQALAAALSAQVESRHRDRGAHVVEIVPEPERYDLGKEPEPAPQPREPEPLATTVTNGVRRAVPLVFAAVLTAVVSATAWTATHTSAGSGPARQASTPTNQTTTPLGQTPTTATEWGQAAHQRLTRAGRPVDVFGCQGAYAADAAVAGTALPPAGTSPDTWHAYLAGCLSDMSDPGVRHSG